VSKHWCEAGSERKNVDSFIYEFPVLSLFSHNTVLRKVARGVSEMWARGSRSTSPMELVRAGSSSLLETRGRMRHYRARRRHCRGGDHRQDQLQFPF